MHILTQVSARAGSQHQPGASTLLTACSHTLLWLWCICVRLFTPRCLVPLLVCCAHHLPGPVFVWCSCHCRYSCPVRLIVCSLCSFVTPPHFAVLTPPLSHTTAAEATQLMSPYVSVRVRLLDRCGPIVSGPSVMLAGRPLLQLLSCFAPWQLSRCVPAGSGGIHLVTVCVCAVKWDLAMHGSSQTRLVSCWCAAGKIKGQAVAYGCVHSAQQAVRCVSNCSAVARQLRCVLRRAVLCWDGPVLQPILAAAGLWRLVRPVQCCGPALTCYAGRAGARRGAAVSAAGVLRGYNQLLSDTVCCSHQGHWLLRPHHISVLLSTSVCMCAPLSPCCLDAGGCVRLVSSHSVTAQQELFGHAFVLPRSLRSVAMAALLPHSRYSSMFLRLFLAPQCGHIGRCSAASQWHAARNAQQPKQRLLALVPGCDAHTTLYQEPQGPCGTLACSYC